MGQKSHPIGMRVGIMKSWPCEWFAKTKDQSADFFVEDIQIRRLIEKTFPRSGIAKVIIRKTETSGEIIIFSAKIGVIAGKDGTKVKSFETLLKKKFHKDFTLTLKEVKLPELSAKIMAEHVAAQIENRMPYRRVCKQTVEKVMEKGAEGIKIQVAGRLGGADIARTEKFAEGRVSLQTFRKDIDYHYTTAITKYGVIGVKVWIGKGTIYNNNNKKKSASSIAMDKLSK
ncbi:MAG: 30S ribosomal protein S3 [Candidatus Peribacteria bacterium]|nr:MAG: 30S ribosomal protein S3 [Candidatus Peribacteria bacterium]